MDPQVNSAITSVLLVIAGSATAILVKDGIISAGDQGSFTSDIAAIIMAIITAAIGWYKANTLSQNSMIKSVNAADNGVKVVPDSSPTSPVSGALK